ncbi:MAG: chemotaxis protein CheX [Planctomycetota bacterium]|nr:chemotaxis protein CheX [Planctomycetota bacterium]
MKVAYINPFILATRNVFDTMIRVPVSVGRPYLRAAKDQPNRCYRISAVIRLSGSATGQVVLNLSESAALALGSGLAGITLRKIDNVCLDALAEFVNRVTGGAKKQFPGGQVSVSLPTLLPTAQVVFPRDCPAVVIPFDTSVGRFTLDISLWGFDVASPRRPAQANQPLSPPTQAAA